MLSTMDPSTLSSLVNEDDEMTRARLLKALAHPARQNILQILHEHEDTMTVQMLTQHFALEQPTISHHLRILYEAGLLRRRRVGLFNYYSVRVEVLQRAASILTGLVS